MSYYLRNSARSLFFNQQDLTPADQDNDDQSTETDPLHPKSSSQFNSSEPPSVPTSTPPSSGLLTDPGPSRMLKRPPFGNGSTATAPSSSLAAGLGNSKPISSQTLGHDTPNGRLYPAQPPRIIGSSSANFGSAGRYPSTDLGGAVEPPLSSLKISFKPSPTSSSTATTTPTSTAPGSVTHQPSASLVDGQMSAHRNGGTGAGGIGAGSYQGNSNVKNHHANSTSASNSVNRGGGTNAYSNNSNSSVNNNNARSRTVAGGGGLAGNQVLPPGATVAGSSGAAMQLALYGWRKKCLYSVILVLMIMIIINLALTLWILKVMEFSSDGMGQLKIVSGGIELTGQATIMDVLRASSIRSKHGLPISIESSRNFSVNTRDAQGILENQLFLGHDRIEVLANHFRILDTHGAALFSVDRDEVAIGASSLRVEGEGGVIFKDSIQTPLVRAEAGKDLKLESPTRSLEARATQEIFLQSRAGSIEANCLNDLKLHSVAGTIRLDASTIMLPNLKTVQPQSSSGSSQSGSSSSRDYSGSSSSSGGASSHGNKIYQLCVCSSGKLFLAPAHSICAADDSAICR
ncbi:uncharacterized protein LOC129737982 isoform X2 [Uranotaenia lowii]|nr:uncharacterized protein LOC129737982 isoform X2 [Uranotaenia lowii]